MSHRPVHQTLPGKLGAPSEPPCQWRECQFEHTTWTALGADVIDQDKFAARLQHPDEIIQRSLWIRHRRYDILRHHGIEELIGEGEILGVHHRERLDIAQPHRPYALLRLAEHGLGYMDAAKFRGARVIRQGQAGADPDIQNSAADLVGLSYGRLPAVFKDLAEHQIIYRRPAPIS